MYIVHHFKGSSGDSFERSSGNLRNCLLESFWSFSVNTHGSLARKLSGNTYRNSSEISCRISSGCSSGKTLKDPQSILSKYHPKILAKIPSWILPEVILKIFPLNLSPVILGAIALDHSESSQKNLPGDSFKNFSGSSSKIFIWSRPEVSPNFICLLVFFF